MRTLKITLAYDGTDFAGWQVQPDRVTIQGCLAEALTRITGEGSLPQGSGRTDAGVHALAQVASCTLRSPIPLPNLVIALNDVLPAAIRVLRIDEAPPEFHARLSARAKTYRYRIFRAPICPPFLARYVYHHPWPLREPAMGLAAARILGEHDFTSLAAVDPERTRRTAAVSAASRAPAENPEAPDIDTEDTEDTEAVNSATACAQPASPSDLPGREHAPLRFRGNVRTIYDSAWRRDGDQLIYTVRGDGFLHHMVRNLVGLFLLVGKGTLTPADIPRIVSARNRGANPGATAPASGLHLVSVEYD